MTVGRAIALGIGTAATIGAVVWYVRSHDDKNDDHVQGSPTPTSTPTESPVVEKPLPTIPEEPGNPLGPQPAPIEKPVVEPAPVAPEPAPVKPKPAPPAPSPKPAVALPPDPPVTGTITYTVKSGDTLWAISRRYDTTPAAIAAASSITVDSIIRPGQKLRVPQGDHTTPTVDPGHPQVPVAPAPSGRPLGPVTGGHVGLTFDDGPNGQYTADILAALNRLNVNATFFVIGQQVQANPALVAKVAAAGNEIANHSWDHADLTKLSDAAIREQLTKTNDAVQSATGKRPTLFRPPYGASNDVVRGAASASGLRVVLWSIDTEDWKRPGTPAIVSSAVSGAREGSIILMHDGGGNRSQTVAAVEQIVNGLRARGLEPVPVSEM